jgi:hypothetical protein
MKHFKSHRQALRFLSAHGQIANRFHLRRGHVTVIEYRTARARAFEMWADASGVPPLPKLRCASHSAYQRGGRRVDKLTVPHFHRRPICLPTVLSALGFMVTRSEAVIAPC